MPLNVQLHHTNITGGENSVYPINDILFHFVDNRT